MKRLIFICVFLTLGFAAMAQNSVEAADTVSAARPDSLYCNLAIAVDENYSGKDIFEVMPSREAGDSATVTVNQSPELRNAMQKRIAESEYRHLNGYRIRIFFSNAQNAREASLAAATSFGARHPGYNIYRSFVNPNFKVTVGDFRTRSDALVLLNAIKSEFPGAFVVKETIHYTY